LAAQAGLDRQRERTADEQATEEHEARGVVGVAEHARGDADRDPRAMRRSPVPASRSWAMWSWRSASISSARRSATAGGWRRV